MSTASSCPEILTRPGNKIHSQSVPPCHIPSSYNFQTKSTCRRFFKLHFALFSQACNRPMGITGE